MNSYWKKFMSLNHGDRTRREAFDELCYNILDKYYPGRPVYSVSEVSKVSDKEPIVIYFPKFFTDKLTDSRQNHIRDKFRSVMKIVKQKKLKVYKWVFCMPYTFSVEEMKWWLSWKEKNQKKEGVDIVLIDDGKIIELARKFEFIDQFFTGRERKNERAEVTDNLVNFNFSEHIDKVVKETKEQENATKNKESKLKDSEQKETSTKQERVVSKEIPEDESVEQDQKQKEYVYAQKMDFVFFQEEYKRLIDLYNDLNPDQKKSFKKLFSYDNFTNFDKDADMPLSSGKKSLNLFYKAKTAEVYNKLLLAYRIFSLLDADKGQKEFLKQKIDIKTIPLKKQEIEKKILSFLNEFEGDLYRINGDDANALEKYEKAYKYNKQNKKLGAKYFNLAAKIAIDKQEYDKARNYLEYSLDNYFDKNIRDELKRIRILEKGKRMYASNSFKAIFSPLFFMVAYAMDKNDKNVRKLMRQSFGVSAKFMALSLVLLGVFILLSVKIIKSFETGKQEAMTVLTEQQIYTEQADKLMSLASKGKFHLLDTVIRKYELAAELSPEDKSIKMKLQKAKKYKKAYLTVAQSRIKVDPNKYLIRLRNFSEGLQLVKYLYDPKRNLGKYGYIDTADNFVIPPVYDFDPNKMYGGTEDFHNGRALVLLKLSTGQKKYFFIDKNNRILKAF